MRILRYLMSWLNDHEDRLTQLEYENRMLREFIEALCKGHPL